MNTYEIIERIKRLRDGNGLNNNVFAARLGLTPNKVAKLLNGHAVISLEFLHDISCAFPDASVGWLANDEHPLPESILHKSIGEFESSGYKVINDISYLHPDTEDYFIKRTDGSMTILQSPNSKKKEDSRPLIDTSKAGVPATLLNQAFEQTVTTAVELEWVNVNPAVPYQMLADLFRRDFESAGGVIAQNAEREANTG